MRLFAAAMCYSAWLPVAIVASSAVAIEFLREASSENFFGHATALKWLVVVGTLAFYGHRWLHSTSHRNRESAGALRKPRQSITIPPISIVERGGDRQPTEPNDVSSWLACCMSRDRETFPEDEAEDFFISSPIRKTSLSGACARSSPRFGATVPEVDAVDESLCRELRIALSDLLGQPGCKPEMAPDPDAVLTVQRYGDERSCMSRFLRARRCNAKDAEKMLRETIDFRREHHVNSILEDPHGVEAWKSARPFWPVTMPFFSADGSLVVYVRMPYFVNLYKDYSEEKLRTLYISMMERSLCLQRQGRRRRGQTVGEEMPPVYEVYDFEGCGVQHISSIMGGVGIMTRMLAIGQKHYPENLRKAVLLHFPSVVESVWRTAVSKVLDKRTQDKIHIFASDGRSSLPAMLGISDAQFDNLFRSIVPYSRGKGNTAIVNCTDLSSCP